MLENPEEIGQITASTTGHEASLDLHRGRLGKRFTEGAVVRVVCHRTV